MQIILMCFQRVMSLHVPNKENPLLNFCSLSLGSHSHDATHRMWFTQKSHSIPVKIICDFSHSFCMAQIAPHLHQNGAGAFFVPHWYQIAWVFTPMWSDSGNHTGFSVLFWAVIYLTLTSAADRMNTMQFQCDAEMHRICCISYTLNHFAAAL